MIERKSSGEKPANNFMVQETVLRIIGVWPITSNEFASKGRWIFAMMTQISGIYSLSLEIYRHCLDIDDTMDAFLMDLSTIVSFSKMFILKMNLKHTHTLVNSVANDWSTFSDSRYEPVMTEYFKKGRAVSLIILYLGSASGFSFILKTIPYDVLLPFEMFQDSPNSTAYANNRLKLNYFLATYCSFGKLPLFPHVSVLILQSVHIYVNVIAHCGNDGLFFNLAMHLCGQFEILKMNLAEIEFEDLAYPKKIGLLVKRHCQLATLIDHLEQSFSTIILIQLLMSALLICVEGFMFLVCLSTKDNVGALKSSILMVTLLIELYLYAYAGDTLQSRAEEVAQAVYDAPWYRSRGHAARELVLIISRGNSPYGVTAGKFVIMNILTFKETLKASVSYLSVLKVMMDT